MVIGIVFTAHQYYHDFGGQGWLKARTDEQNGKTSDDPVQLYLPIRQIQVFKNPAVWERQAGDNVPFYTCGDQQNSCESFKQPNICCPVGMTCYAATFTPSGIYCCNSTDSDYNCEASESDPPKCMASLVECSPETGGGCCPSTLECSPNGCVHVNNASTISPPSTVPATSSPSNSQGTQAAPAMTSNSLGTPITVTSTIFQAPQATVTLAKEGEILAARVGAGGSSIVLSFWIPYAATMLIGCIAVLMGRL
ncbi:uncharacterized protein LY89DRAFT_781430 [Mollisia scopiformis]|uniref:Uncharacterized protein n=1 Tax=Mollisia scopiformis TaxID=149040 RepID=A0A194XDW5_MOLSC|nr:uncharacterized protein LY89DRAFT_781430 [Mollisia scopiformis]KUJ18368.1 hypothetical protein LY89DRAFT_781430 [Mollisia scopiformis]